MGVRVMVRAKESWGEFRHTFSSKEAFLDYVQVEQFIDKDGNVNTWRNEDLSPTPPEKRSKESFSEDRIIAYQTLAW